ncbi:MAG TPA: L-ribulose-5-phosphate 4-epimerase [Flavobacteriaceae bacterium]|nr:L-ribulose-5-phosphate 4-epimerase [Flavobacteriaceae bacterium]
MNLIKKDVLMANRWIVEKGLVDLTWGNVSYCDRDNQLIYIKPSGVKLSSASPGDISCIDFQENLIDGLKCSVDTPTHVEIYKAFDDTRCVIHTHSKYATIFAQANMEIPCLGTTHADYFYGNIPCVPCPNHTEIESAYEKFTGKSITSFYNEKNIVYNEVQACLVSGHGPFVWGNTIEKALENAQVLEIVAEYAYKTLMLNKESYLPQYILNKHFLRKHGAKKYYGQ